MVTPLATFLATALVLGFPLWLTAKRAHAAEDRAQVAWAGHQEIAADNARLRTMLASAEADVDWAQVVLAETAADRDMYATALRGELERQARAELLRPDEAVGVATVLEFKRGAK